MDREELHKLVDLLHKDDLQEVGEVLQPYADRAGVQRFRVGQDVQLVVTHPGLPQLAAGSVGVVEEADATLYPPRVSVHFQVDGITADCDPESLKPAG